METFANNKEMGRVLVRREGETIAAGSSISHSMLIHKLMVSQALYLESQRKCRRSNIVFTNSRGYDSEEERKEVSRHT